MINFNKKASSGCAPATIDVSVTSGRQNGGDSGVYLRFSFSERVAMMVFGTELYGVVGQDPCNPSRLYFQADNRISGYKISGAHESSRKYSTFGCCYPVEKYSDFIGYYNMKFDKVNGAFYIDRAEKKK